MTTSAMVLLSGLLLAGGPQADLQVGEVVTKEVVDLLSGLTLVYDSGLKSGFRMRAFSYERDGECAEGEPCSKDELLVSVASLDEYPEKKAFRLSFTGVFARLVALQVPKGEKGEFRLALHIQNVSGVEACSVYAVTLSEMHRLPGACPSARGGK